MQNYVRRREREPLYLPTESELLEAGEIERCPHCMLLWPSGRMTTEDGRRVCQNGASPTTVPTYIAAVKERVAAEAERYVRYPRISQARMVQPPQPTINVIMNTSGDLIYSGAPIVIARGSAGTLTLRGFELSASDTFTFSANISGVATVIDDTEVSLEITAGVSAVIGKHSIYFNGDRVMRGVLLVR